MSACGLQDGTAHYSLATGKHLEMFYFTSIVKIHLWPTVLKKKKAQKQQQQQKSRPYGVCIVYPSKTILKNNTYLSSSWLCVK